MHCAAARNFVSTMFVHSSSLMPSCQRRGYLQSSPCGSSIHPRPLACTAWSTSCTLVDRRKRRQVRFVLCLLSSSHNDIRARRCWRKICATRRGVESAGKRVGKLTCKRKKRSVHVNLRLEMWNNRISAFRVRSTRSVANFSLC